MGSMYPESNYSGNFFEGTEKLLEIWFSREEDLNYTDCDLRNIPRPKLEKMLELVHCEVISFTRNDNIDAYVLRYCAALIIYHLDLSIWSCETCFSICSIGFTLAFIIYVNLHKISILVSTEKYISMQMLTLHGWNSQSLTTGEHSVKLKTL